MNNTHMSFKDRLNKNKNRYIQKNTTQKYETKSDMGTDETMDDVSREPVSLVNHIRKLKKVFLKQNNTLKINKQMFLKTNRHFQKKRIN